MQVPIPPELSSWCLPPFTAPQEWANSSSSLSYPLSSRFRATQRASSPSLPLQGSTPLACLVSRQRSSVVTRWFCWDKVDRDRQWLPCWPCWITNPEPCVKLNVFPLLLFSLLLLSPSPSLHLYLSISISLRVLHLLCVQLFVWQSFFIGMDSYQPPHWVLYCLSLSSCRTQQHHDAIGRPPDSLCPSFHLSSDQETFHHHTFSSPLSRLTIFGFGVCCLCNILFIHRGLLIRHHFDSDSSLSMLPSFCSE